MIEIDGLVKTYGAVQAVQGLSLTVRRGEIVGLVGPNGAGKTTTLRCVTGIIPPTSGKVRIGGFDLMAQPLEAKRRLAFVPDEPRLFDYLTAWDHLTITSRLYGVADGERVRVVSRRGAVEAPVRYDDTSGPSSFSMSSSSPTGAMPTRPSCRAG